MKIEPGVKIEHRFQQDLLLPNPQIVCTLLHKNDPMNIQRDCIEFRKGVFDG